MTDAEWSTVQSIAWGGYGPGPYFLFDPFAVNMLTPNLASGGDVLGDSTGFSVTGSGYTLSTVTSGGRTGPKAQRLVIPAAAGAGAGMLWVGPQTVTRDLTPVIAGAQHTASCWVKLSTGTPVLTALAIRWLDAALATVGTDTTGAAATPTGTFALYQATSAAPAGAIYGRPYLVNTAVASAGYTVIADDFQLERATQASTWVFGTGVARVSFVGTLGHGVPITGLHNADLELAEVG